MGIVSIFLLCTFIFMIGALKSSYSSSLEDKVIGGCDTIPGEIRYLAYFSHNGEFKCNAFLISESNALVPAHSLEKFWMDYPPPTFSEYYILAIGYDNGPKNDRFEILQVEHISRYEFSPEELNFSYDIAVIKFQTRMTSSALNYIELPLGNELSFVNGDQFFTVGWETSPFTGDLSVKKVFISKIRSKSACGVSSNIFIYCVEANATFSSEDLGTPLIVEGRPIGIMTATVNGKPNLAVFTSVLAHRDEIQRLRDITRMSTYINAPRAFARHDWRAKFHPLPPHYLTKLRMAAK